MKLQFLRGNTAANDAYQGSIGEITVDETRGKLRVHDGVTVGGKEIGEVQPWVGRINCAGRQEVADGTYDLAIPQPGGFYRIGGGPANRPALDGILGHPSGSASYEHSHDGGLNYHSFLLFADSPDMTRPPSIYQKGFLGGQECQWVFNYNTENILRNVAFDGTRPTRYLIDKADNENGIYHKTAEGYQKTLVKHSGLTVTSGDVVDVEGFELLSLDALFPSNITLPATFSNIDPQTFINAFFDDTSLHVKGFGVDTSQSTLSNIRLLVEVGAGTTVGKTFSFSAVTHGRWD